MELLVYTEDPFFFSIWRKKHNANQLNATYNIETAMALL